MVIESEEIRNLCISGVVSTLSDLLRPWESIEGLNTGLGGKYRVINVHNLVGEFLSKIESFPFHLQFLFALHLNSRFDFTNGSCDSFLLKK